MNNKKARSDKKGMNSGKGFSLVEVIISIGILGIVTAAIVTYFTWSFGVFNYTNVKATEESLARTQMELIKSVPWSESGAYPTYTPSPPPKGTYSIAFTATNVTGQAGLQLITIDVSRTYSDSAGNQSTDNVTLQGYKGDR